jgi:hypothetical protein
VRLRVESNSRQRLRAIKKLQILNEAAREGFAGSEINRIRRSVGAWASAVESEGGRAFTDLLASAAVLRIHSDAGALHGRWRGKRADSRAPRSKTRRQKIRLRDQHACRSSSEMLLP